MVRTSKRVRKKQQHRVKWPDDEGGRLITVHVIRQSRREARQERRAENIGETTDLVCRHFDAPLARGGCAGQWSLLIAKVSALNEPDYATVGIFWARRFGSDTPRPEEHGCSNVSKNMKLGPFGVNCAQGVAPNTALFEPQNS